MPQAVSNADIARIFARYATLLEIEAANPFRVRAYQNAAWLIQGLPRSIPDVVCAVHENFDLGRDKQTERIMRAMDNPFFNILAHPSGRLLGERKGYAFDLERVMAAALQRGCFLEANAQPQRLDLAGPECHIARKMRLKLAIFTDSHSSAQLSNIRLGVAQARRGWLEAGDVLNTRSWP